MQFKRLLKTNKKLKVSKQHYWIAPFLVIGAIASCAVTKVKPSQDSSLISISGAIKAITGYENNIKLVLKGTDQSLIEFSKNFCSPVSADAKESSIRFKIATAQGVYNSALTPLFHEENSVLAFTVGDNFQGSFPGFDMSDLSASIKKICQKQEPIVQLDNHKNFLNLIVKTLETLAPHCEFQVWADHFNCVPEEVNPLSVKNSLASLNKKILSNFKRPPYILMRKLSIVRQFADFISNEKSLNPICKLSKQSFAEEIPIVMRTNEWKNGVCSDSDTHQKQVLANLALRYAHQEILLLTSTSKQTTSRGFVSVRLNSGLPEDQRNVVVRMWPSDDVYKSISSFMVKDTVENDLKIECWGPFVSDGSFEGEKLASLGISSDDNPICKHTKEGFNAAVKEITYSITGDSNFVVSNYRGKLVRLPRGTYNYEVFALPKDPKSDSLNSGLSLRTGTLTWSGRRNNTIR